MPLTNYKEARPWAKAIQQMVSSRKMPPWFAETAAVSFSNDPRLSSAEVDAIANWVKQGAPEGPRLSTVASKATPPSPFDLTLRMPTPVRVPARGEIPYQFVILPQRFDKDTWVRRVEVSPGVRGVVHHVVVYVRERGGAWLDGKPEGVPFSSPGATKSDILAVYAPGQPAAEFPESMAKLIPAGAQIVLQIHYTPNGKAVEDRTVVHLSYSKSTPSKRVLTLQIATTDFLIPAGESNHRVTAFGTLPNDALLLGLFPHMHLRGKAFEYAVAQTGGRIEVLLRVKPYDFHWQLYYRLAEPRPLPKGTRLVCTAWYDNSRNNPRNPDPEADVRYGEPSTDEMMVGFFDIAVPAAMDKNSFFQR
ncbi:MAG: thiol-disulfide isomerase [Candidatus Solibacter usitatus]|nr:thiol-disulfide isomerase [Candidatus Solibacter usitatus]